MPLDLNSNHEPIDKNDPQYQDVLQDLQGNILRGHGRNESVHIFLTFPNPTKENLDKIAALKQWIVQLATQDITSAKKQLDDAVAWREKKIDGGVFVHFCLSSSGYNKLGLPNTTQPKGPNLQNRKQPDAKGLNDDYAEVFQDGMKTRQYALLDPPVSAWEPEFQKDIDALVIVAANNLTDVKKKQSEITDKLKNIATVASVQQGTILRRQFKNTGSEHVVEHFGYTDGVGQPLFLKQDVDQEQGGTSKRLFSAPLNLVLIPDPLGTPNVSFGSFLVFRKLEQNVQGFKKAEVALGQKLGISPQLAGAMAVGRFEDGTPLILQSQDGGTKLNDFDYSRDAFGLKCPFQAHTRKTNPRLESVREGGPFAQSNEQELGHRIARRAVSYGGPINDFSGNLDNLPQGGVGLLFMCYQSDIWEQFEFIQRFWSNNPRFLEPDMSKSRDVINGNYDKSGLDAVSGRSQPGQSDPQIEEEPKPPQNWLKERDQKTTKANVNFGEFVTLKGGEYFFSPSISFLKKLPNLLQYYPTPPIQEPTPARTYVVQSGDDLSLIAQKAYRDGSFFRVIYDANKNVIGSNPNSLIPGQILYIPLLPQNTRPTPGQTYVVQPGDFLFLIAQRAYGDGNLFRLIYEANRNVIGPDPTVLVPGQVISIPPKQQ